VTVTVTVKERLRERGLAVSLHDMMLAEEDLHDVASFHMYISNAVTATVHVF
jgi:hypothetical protein